MTEHQPQRSRNTPALIRHITKERLNGASADLTSFVFRYGANVYVFSYDHEGTRRHIMVDAGDLHHRDYMLSVLTQNGINPANIERIILTHRHPDHSGLTYLLARQSDAKITVHLNFKRFIEGGVSEMERRWLRNFDIAMLKGCNIEYLPTPDKAKVMTINGVDFPVLGKPIELGNAGQLVILTCPESASTHSPDQLLILYSPKRQQNKDGRPTDEVLFSGDLWLMTGPMHDKSLASLNRRLRFGFYRLKDRLSGKGVAFRPNVLEQDAQAKEALKRGFTLIRVKPGHSEEFLGTRIIPYGLLADRDLLVALGYPMNTDGSILRSAEMAPKVAAIKGQAYSKFVKELLVWSEMGYSPDEMRDLIVRIYREQSGGGKLAEKDRKQRRKTLKETLSRLKNDKSQSDELYRLAESALQGIKKIRG